MIIKINETQYINYIKNLNEGVRYTKNNNGGISFNINTSQTDKLNSKSQNVDTRVFGTKQNVLHGDGTASAHTQSLSDSFKSKKASIEFYQSIIDACENNDLSLIKWDIENLPAMSQTSCKKWFNGDYDLNKIKTQAKVSLDRVTKDAEPINNTYNRALSVSNDNDKVARYNVLTIPGTNVKCIALFTMGDFNFSDAIKHGTLRQNALTDNVFKYKSTDERETNNDGSLKTISATYDGDITPDIESNFSLKNVGDGHYKSQYGLNGKNIGQGERTSVTQFLEKSIIYADYALKQEHFRPDVIIAPPSSSKFNHYYCQNLSNKLGVPYIPDFFKRNVINVKLQKWGDYKMLEDGFTEKEVLDFETQVKNYSYKEITYICSQPLRDFFNQNLELLNDIPIKRQSRNKANKDLLYTTLSKYTYNIILNNLKSPISKEIIKKHINQKLHEYGRNYDTEWIMQHINKRLKLAGRNDTYQNVLSAIQENLQKYEEQIKTGYKPFHSSKPMKIVNFSQRYRKYLNDVYIISDKNCNKNGDLLSRLKNAKFCIFDEDINSGGTFKLVIDILTEKIDNNNQSNIIGLANAYSNSGF